MTSKERKSKKLDPESEEWEKLANELARSWVFIISCKHCGYPVVEGYSCVNCGSNDPR